MKKFNRLLLIAIVGTLMITCTASAQIIEEKNGYIVRSGYDVEEETGVLSMNSLASSLYSIRQGDINYHSNYVSSGKTLITYDVDWGDSDNDLGLQVVTPDGTYLGYYHDSIDGSTDGRIYLEISNPGDLSSGSWKGRVRGYSVSGTEYYDWEVIAA
ncbi:hypothetical protein [Methanolacinia petrolearia]|nr:hypothetical protein [Methanolacinia petrolearia]